MQYSVVTVSYFDNACDVDLVCRTEASAPMQGVGRPRLWYATPGVKVYAESWHAVQWGSPILGANMHKIAMFHEPRPAAWINGNSFVYCHARHGRSFAKCSITCPCYGLGGRPLWINGNKVSMSWTAAMPPWQ